MADMKCFKSCGLCQKKFEKSKILTCFHAFCENCLESNIFSGKVSCPLCVTEHLLPSEGVQKLVDNAFIDVADLEAGSKYYCGRHKGKELEFFCRNCRCVICASCCIIQDHKSHTTVDLADVHGEFRDILMSCTETFEEKLQQCRAQTETLDQNITDLREIGFNKCHDVDKQIKQIQDKAKSTGEGIKNEISNICQNGIDKLERDKKKLEEKIYQMETAANCTKKVLATNTTKLLTEIAPHTQKITRDNREISLDIQEVKIPYFQRKDFSKETMEKLFGRLELGSCATFTRRFNTEEITDKIYMSKEQMIHELSLSVGTKKISDSNMTAMGVHLFLNKADGNDVRSCRANFIAKLVHKADDKKSKIRKHECRLEPGSAGYGWNAFIPWKDLIDPKNGFIDDNKFTLQITVGIIHVQ